MPRFVHMSREPLGDAIYIGPGSPWHPPSGHIGDHAMHERWLKTQPELTQERWRLTGKNLAGFDRTHALMWLRIAAYDDDEMMEWLLA